MEAERAGATPPNPCHLPGGLEEERLCSHWGASTLNCACGDGEACRILTKFLCIMTWVCLPPPPSLGCSSSSCPASRHGNGNAFWVSWEVERGVKRKLQLHFLTLASVNQVLALTSWPPQLRWALGQGQAGVQQSPLDSRRFPLALSPSPHPIPSLGTLRTGTPPSDHPQGRGKVGKASWQLRHPLAAPSTAP